MPNDDEYEKKNIIKSIKALIAKYNQLNTESDIDNDLNVAMMTEKSKKHILDCLKHEIQKIYGKDAYGKDNSSEKNIEIILDIIQDQEIDIDIINAIMASDIEYQMQQQGNFFTSFKAGMHGVVNTIFGHFDSIKYIMDEINRRKLTLLVYKTSKGYKATFVSTKNIDTVLSNILPKTKYEQKVKINNCSYFGNQYGAYYSTYINNADKLKNFDIAIIPAISNNSIAQAETNIDANNQYQVMYKKIFNFFNQKNIPISLTQTSACKGNNFSFSLSDKINEEIEDLNISSINMIDGMLLPNFYDRYVDSTVNCFYKKNIKNIHASFNFPKPSQVDKLHRLNGSIMYATNTIQKILQRAENLPKEEKISILEKIYKSFQMPILLYMSEKEKIMYFLANLSFDDKTFLSNIKLVADFVTNDENKIDLQVKDWILSSIEEFKKKDNQSDISFIDILKNNKLYDEKKMQCPLAFFEVLETNKNQIKTFMEKYRIKMDDVKLTKEIIKNNINNDRSIAQRNKYKMSEISLDEINKLIAEIQRNNNYKKNDSQCQNKCNPLSLSNINKSNAKDNIQ